VRDCRVQVEENIFLSSQKCRFGYQSRARCAQARRSLRVVILSKGLKYFCCRGAQDQRLHHLVVIGDLSQEVCAIVSSGGI
jgi:hypothetical protein